MVFLVIDELRKRDAAFIAVLLHDHIRNGTGITQIAGRRYTVSYLSDVGQVIEVGLHILNPFDNQPIAVVVILGLNVAHISTGMMLILQAAVCSMTLKCVWPPT